MKKAALATPNQLILTGATARRIVGDADPIGSRWLAAVADPVKSLRYE